MGNKKLLTIILSLLLCTLFLFASCSDSEKPESIEVYLDGVLLDGGEHSVTVTYGETVDLVNRVRVKTIDKRGDVTELAADSQDYSILNVPERFEVGTYELQVKYGEFDAVKFVLTITPKAVAKPTGTLEVNYNGSAQTFTPSGFDGARMTISGNVSTDAGLKTAVINLIDAKNYSWADGTASAVELPWSIAKVAPQYSVPQGLTAHVGDRLSDVTLPTAANGSWSWTDGNLGVGVRGRNTHSAIFTPTDTTNYNVVTGLDVVVSVSLDSYTNITYPVITGKTYDPEATLASFPLQSNFRWADSTIVPTCNVTEYEAIYNGDPSCYNDFELTISISLQKAVSSYKVHNSLSGTYSPTKTLADYELDEYFSWVTPDEVPHCDKVYYEATYNTDPVNYNDYEMFVEISIERADYTSATAHASLSGTYDPNKRLGDYALSSGYFWIELQVIPTCDVTEYDACYNGDVENYNNYAIKITLTLAKAEYEGITYEVLYDTYDPNKTLANYPLDSRYSWADNAITPTCVQNATGYPAVYNADAVNYNDFELNIIINLAKATPSINTPTGLSGIAGKTLSTVTLPTDANGVWSWYDGTAILSAEVSRYTATFTPTDTVNYNTPNDSEVFVNVSQLEVKTINGTITGSEKISAFYDYNDSASVTVSTIPEGYYFVCWKKDGDTVSTATTYIFNVTESVELTAVTAEIAVTSIAPSGDFLVKDYRLNQEPDVSGMSILVSCNNGDEAVKAVLLSYVSDFDTSTGGNGKTATITYAGKTCTFTYNVIPPVLQSIELSDTGWNYFSINDRHYSVYDYETPDDPTDDIYDYAIVLALKYDYDASSELYPATVNVIEVPEGFSTESAGQFSITLNYGGKSCLYSYTVFPTNFDISYVPSFNLVDYGTYLYDLDIAEYDVAGTDGFTWAWKDDTVTVGDAGTNYFRATCTFAADSTTIDYDVRVKVHRIPAPSDLYSACIPSNLSATCGQTLGDVDVSSFNNEFGTWQWVNSFEVLSQAANITRTIVFVPTNTNYRWVDVEVNVLVTTAD